MSDEDRDPDRPNLGLAVPGILVSDETTEAFATLADTGIDLAIEQGAFDGVPILGILTGVWKAGRKMKDEIEYRNIARFLSGLSETSQQERERFVSKRREDESLISFGENILLLIQRVDDVKKPEMIGRLMAACIQGHLEYTDAMRLAAIVDRCYLSDIERLRKNNGEVGQLHDEIKESLFSIGVLRNAGATFGGGNLYELNRYGELLLRFGFD